MKTGVAIDAEEAAIVKAQSRKLKLWANNLA